MPAKCAAGNCAAIQGYSSSKFPERPFLKFYKFPSCPLLRKKWVDRCGREPSKFTVGSKKICSDHFFEEDLEDECLASVMRRHNLGFDITHDKLLLKQDSVPNTNRHTDEKVDFLARSGSKLGPPLTTGLRSSRQVLPQIGKHRAPAETSETESELKSLKDPDFYDSLLEENQRVMKKPKLLENRACNSVQDTPGLPLSDQVPNLAPISPIYMDDLGEDLPEEDSENDSYIGDPDYVPEELESGEDEDIGEADINIEEKMNQDGKFVWLLTSLSSILMLLQHCVECNERYESRMISTVGFVTKILCTCPDGHTYMWQSSPVTKRRWDLNVVVSCAASLCGIGHSTLKSLFSTIQAPFLGKTCYHKITNNFLRPAVFQIYESRMKEVYAFFKDHDEVRVGGDGQFDSPGFCAKFCRYSLLEHSTGKLLSFFVVQKGQYSGELEKVGCKEALLSLSDKIPNLKHLVVDRHSGIKKMMPLLFPDIVLHHDIWHMARNIKKALKKVTKLAAYKNLDQWSKHVINHFWWSASHCDGSSAKLLQLFHSVLFHTINVHKWAKNPRAQWYKELVGEGEYPGTFAAVQKCMHAPLTRRDVRTMAWLEKGGLEHTKLADIVTNPFLCEDMKRCTSFIHTGQNEVLHSVVLKYLPKRKHFPMKTQIVRMMIVSLEVDENTGFNLKKPIQAVSYSKAAGDWLMKTRYSEKTYDYRRTVMDAVQTNLVSGRISLLDWTPYIRAPVPKNIVAKPKPTLVELKARSYQRI